MISITFEHDLWKNKIFNASSKSTMFRPSQATQHTKVMVSQTPSMIFSKLSEMGRHMDTSSLQQVLSKIFL
jgi:hypothetical protein